MHSDRTTRNNAFYPVDWIVLGYCITMALLLVIRMVFEERMLRKELPGYEAYMFRTPHRLIPGVW